MGVGSGPKKVDLNKFLGRLASVRVDTPDAKPVAVLTSNRVSVDEDLMITIGRTWNIESAAARIASESNFEPEELLPFPVELPPLSPTDNGAAYVDSVTGRRDCSIVDDSVLGTFLEDAGERAVSASVALTKKEIQQQSAVTVSTTQPAFALTQKKFSFRQLLPSTVLHVDFRSNVPPPLYFDMTSAATIDVVVLVFKFDPSADKAKLREYVRNAPTKFGAGQALPFMMTQLSETVASIQGNLAVVASDAKRLPPSMMGANKWFRRRWGRVQKRWIADVKSASSNLEALQDRIAETPTPATEQSVSQLVSAFESALSDEIFFCALGRVDEEGRVCGPSLLWNRHRSNESMTKLTRILVPVTVDRELGGQKRVSTLVLLLLGCLMIGLSIFDRSWLPNLSWVPCSEWLGRNLWPGGQALNAGSELGSSYSSDALVSILLIFPALLFSQFFQTRPRSAIASRAQLGIFALTSLAFTLPLVPAALLVTSVATNVVAMVMFAIGLLTVAVAFAYLKMFSSGMLSRVRVSEAYRGGFDLLKGLG